VQNKISNKKLNEGNKMKNYDVIFVGGSLMASATAYTMLNENPNMKILMIEKDPTYKFAATPLALGGIRQQFSERINIRMAKMSVETFENFGELMETKAFGKPEIDLRQGGYLFLVDESKWPVALENAKVQKEEGVDIKLLSPSDLETMLPETDLSGIVGGTVCLREGILDPQSVLTGYLRKVRELGAELITDEVIGMKMAGDKISEVNCKSGETYSADIVVNAAGPWAKEIGKMIGLDIPVEPMAHDLYVAKMPMDANVGNSYTTLPTTTWWYREHQTGDTLLCGKTKLDFSFGFDFNVDVPYFEAEIWPDLADRMEKLDNLKLLKYWRGCYEYNPIDFNAIIGQHPYVPNFYLINGFSGHGLMQAPAAGRGLAEHIMYGEYRTLDLSAMNIRRFRENKLIVEKAII
jgi:FAD-dependent oxidoreductase domain-containing protein 1